MTHINKIDKINITLIIKIILDYYKNILTK